MLMTMRSCTEAARAIGYVTAAALDRAHRDPDADVRRRELAFAELMIPIVKGWGTEIAQKTAYLGVQVHGGMGFIEETGAAQYVRDARITTIYEGTTGIQANDLIGRKITRDGGKALAVAVAEMRGVQRQLADVGSEDLVAIAARLGAGVDALEEAGRWVVARFADDSRAVLAGAGSFLELAGIVSGGWQLGRAAIVAARKLGAGEGDATFLRGKIASARHFADHCLTQAPGLRDTVVAGAAGVLALAEEEI
jgi:acyl-CoA dehydrogenase